MDQNNILLIEPFYGGSHKQLIDLIQDIGKCSVFTLSAKKWHWRARTSALYFAQNIPRIHQYRTLFASSVLNLAELAALRPDLGRIRKVVYFHENQLVYPVRKHKDRDFQYGYNQILTCLVADVVVFNSQYNMDSFLGSIGPFFKTMPDYRPKKLEDEIVHKCHVIHFPILMPPVDSVVKDLNKLHIVWPHRWEHDKDPDRFFSVIFRLEENKIPFRLSVLGEQFSELPEIFAKAQTQLTARIVIWGHQASKENYLRALRSADVVVSTARHEFFGVAMLEAVACGCYPLCPKALVYPEIFPDDQLFNRLKKFCQRPETVRQHSVQVDVNKYSWEKLKPIYAMLLRQE